MQGGGTGAPVQTECYTYDALDQLVQAWSAKDNCAANPSSTKSNATVGGPQAYWTTWALRRRG